MTSQRVAMVARAYHAPISLRSGGFLSRWGFVIRVDLTDEREVLVYSDDARDIDFKVGDVAILSPIDDGFILFPAYVLAK